jgi:uracil-DNA glycosylase
MGKKLGAKDEENQSLMRLMDKAQACRVCDLPHEPRPVFRLSSTARLLIVGQAPGTKVHETGVPWNDRSGDRLRDWLHIERETFYDASRIAILPMGLCFPGQDARGADLPPRGECAPLWHRQFRPLLADIRLTLLVGSYAQAFYLQERKKASLCETVRHFQDFLPAYFPLPHPSWRNTAWLKTNPWFETDVLPELRKRVRALL